jgi:outer membrane immunogenic protein
MRRALSSIASTMVLAGSLLYPTLGRSADLPGARASSVPMMATNWAGAYVGGNLGYAFGQARGADLDGFKAGVQLGVNFQTDRLVYGAELDLGYGGIDYRGFADTFRQKWIGSGRARVGYAFDRFMPFVTGGIAFTNATMKAGGAKESNTHVGYVIGIGGEMMVTDKLSASLQLLHYRFNSQTYNVLPAARNANIVTNELRIGVNYRF